MRDLLKQFLSAIVTGLTVGLLAGVIIHHQPGRRAKVISLGAEPNNLAPGLLTVTWAGQSCLNLDGGAAVYPSDPFVMGGYEGVHMAGATISCESPFGPTPASGSITAQLSTDSVAWFASTVTAAVIDAGYGDGGGPAALVISSQSAAFGRVELTSVTALTADGGYFCDGGNALPNVVACFGGTPYGSYIDSGVNFCDGGSANFCDAGLFGYDITLGQQLCCNAVTVPE